MKHKLTISIVVALLVSCNQHSKSDNYVKTTQRQDRFEIKNDTMKSNVINFNINDFKEIKGYKNIDFESSNYLYDNYIQPISRQTFQTQFNMDSINKDDLSTEKTFYLNTDYGKVKFESVEDGDMFLEYHYLKSAVIPNYKIIVVYGIDGVCTIFLDNRTFEGFKTNGSVIFSNDKQYFISFYNTPDYCLLEIYKATDKIVNIANLYSKNNLIDRVSWGNEFLFETVLTKNHRNYYRLNFSKILQKW